MKFVTPQNRPVFSMPVRFRLIVRIPTLRPNPAEIFRFHPDFSAYSELFSMENSVTFPSDPNRDPNAEKSVGIIRAGKDDVVKISERKGAEMARNIR